ncbi:DUF2125 domain-containing protein [Acidisphaera sp. L21]|uniref:DUF2125 domain-containing protein n=1 Tax=Acidisphaera sp. L21 TaxID=1641851 RepID=UPI00131E3B46|nr:DUF2125 domain-containing protein [Acidisphaera sp. L21]
MSRPLRLCLIAVAVIVMLAIADTAGWWWLTARLASEATAWQQDRIAAGYRVTAGEPARAGWPFHAELRIPNVAVATGTPGAANAVAWQGGQARLIYVPWRPSEVAIDLDGPQSVQLGNAPPVTLALDTLDLAVPLNQSGQAGGFVATMRRLQFAVPAGTIAVDSVWLKVGPQDLRVALSALTLPGRAMPLGLTIGSLDLHASSTVPLPDAREPAAAATAWRNAGGQIVVNQFALGWGPLDLHGTAMFTLDQGLQPSGNGTLRMTGFTEAVDALARTGAITRNDARVAGTLLSLMSHSSGDGVPQADLPFAFRDGLLSAGAIPLMKLPRLALP